MTQFRRLLLASAALIALASTPARAELDVSALKSMIAVSLERDYPPSTRSTRICTRIPSSPSRR